MLVLSRRESERIWIGDDIFVMVWVPTKSAGRTITGTGLRSKEGTIARKSHDGAAIQPRKIPDSVIRVYREMCRGIDHPAVYPVEFPTHLIRSYSLEGDTILDPFMGSGTTGVACIETGRQFIGVEIEPKYFDIACRRIERAWRDKRSEIPFEKPAPLVQQALIEDAT